MTWVLISFTVVGVWSMLSVFGGERLRQINEIQARKQLEATAAEPTQKNTNH